MATHGLSRQVSRFAFSGLLVTALHVFVAVSLIRLGRLAPGLANGGAFMVATIFSYVINTLWSFSRPLNGKNMLRFVLVSIVGCILATSASGLADFYGIHYWFGIACVVCTVPPVTFLLHSIWTYR